MAIYLYHLVRTYQKKKSPYKSVNINITYKIANIIKYTFYNFKQRNSLFEITGVIYSIPCNDYYTVLCR